MIPRKKVVFVTIQCSAGVLGNLVGHLYFLLTLKFQNINFLSIGIVKPKNPLQKVSISNGIRTSLLDKSFLVSDKCRL